MIFVIQCKECGHWRIAETNDLPYYKFKCVKSNCVLSHKPKQMRTHGYYGFNFKECQSMKEAELRVKKLNDEVR